jgi:hypothetical protein
MSVSPKLEPRMPRNALRLQEIAVSPPRCSCCHRVGGSLHRPRPGCRPSDPRIALQLPDVDAGAACSSVAGALEPGAQEPSGRRMCQEPREAAVRIDAPPPVPNSPPIARLAEQLRRPPEHRTVARSAHEMSRPDVPKGLLDVPAEDRLELLPGPLIDPRLIERAWCRSCREEKESAIPPVVPKSAAVGPVKGLP